MLRILDRIYLGAASADSGGGSVDESRIIVKSATIPTAGEGYLGSVYMYVGETNSTYTHGYIYECVESGSTYAWERIDVQPGATRGRFLALWNCATGLAETNPPSSPYPYGAGDYYIVGTVGTTNYKPSGSSYVIGTASTTVETDDVAVNDTYYYDGNSWNLQKNTATEYVAGTGISINNKTISVASPTLTNTSTGSGSLTISGTSASEASATNVGVSSSASGSFGSSFGWGSSASGNYSTAVGAQSTAYFYSAAFGYGSTASSQNTTSIGPSSTASAYGAVALGHNAKATKESAIQIGNGVNSEDKTMYVGALINNTNHNYKLLDLTTGKIPADRLPSTAHSIDNVTITENSSNELQASAVMNARTGTDVMPIWQGTEQEWTNGKSTDWYNWRTRATATTTNITTLPNATYRQMAFGNNKFVIVASTGIAYSVDGETNWTFSNTVTDLYGIVFDGTKFVAVGNNKTAYSLDGINWIENANSQDLRVVAYTNNKYVAINNSTALDTYMYSEDGINWQSKQLPAMYGMTYVCGGNGKFIITLGQSSSTNVAIYSEDGLAWSNITLPSSGFWRRVVYGNNKFVAIRGNGTADNTNVGAYSEDGLTWSSMTLPSYGTWSALGYGNGIFVAAKGYNNTSYRSNLGAFSYDGINWTELTLYTNTFWSYVCYGDNKFILNGSDNSATRVNKVTINASQVYTTEAEPTTASTVYSAPNTTSALTITSIGTGTITLSDNNTYTYTSSGDVTTYQTIGDAYPNYLANINGVGVKIGNTLIADYTNTATFQTTSNLVTSVSSSSTDTQYPSAKLLYDTVGNIEATLDAIIAQGSNS